MHEEIAPTLLCEIAHKASMRVVMQALTAAGAPSSREDIRQGLQAVKERHEAQK
jgi:hypothetical protein